MKTSLQEDALLHLQSELSFLKAYLGLSEYEVRVYAFLVKEGPSTARRISLKCGIPRTKVYCVLKRLMEQEMIAEIPLKPKLFAALPPSEVLQPLIDLQEKIRNRLSEIFLDLQRRYEGSTRSKIICEEVWILSGEEAFKKVLELLYGAEKNIEIFTSWKFFLHIYGFLRKSLDKLLERGVDVCLYFPLNSGFNERFCRNMGLRYRIVRSLPATLIISIDGNSIIFYTTADNEDNSLCGGEWILIHGKKLLNILNGTLICIKEGSP